MSMRKFGVTLVAIGSGLLGCRPAEDGSAFLGDQRAYLFDPPTNGWTRTGDLPAPFGGGIGVNAVLLRDGNVFIAGGYAPNFPEANDAAAIYDVGTGTWTAQNPLPRAV